MATFWAGLHVLGEIFPSKLRSLKSEQQHLYVLERQYAAALYTMFSGRTPPVDNTRVRLDGDYEDIHPQLYDEDAVRDVAHVLGRSWMSLGLFAIRYIGHRSPRQKEKERSVGDGAQNQSRL
jgi:hypothetical protein